MSLPDKLKKALEKDGALDIGGVVEGSEAFVLADVARHRAKKRPLVFVMRDGSRMARPRKPPRGGWRRWRR